MKKIMKVAISIVMSLAMVICLASTEVRAKAVSGEEGGISHPNFNIGVPYSIQDKRGRITAQFSGQGTLLITYTELTSTSRYINMYVSTPSKSFKVRNFVVTPTKAHSESYDINTTSGTVTIEVFRHTSTKPSSGQIDPLKGILQ